MEEFLAYLKWAEQVPQAVWGASGTGLLWLIGYIYSRIRSGPIDQRVVLYNNIRTLLSREKGWTASPGSNKITFGNHAMIEWSAVTKDNNATVVVKVVLGAADQTELLYDKHKKAVLEMAKDRHSKILGDHLQNRAAGANMLVATLATAD